MQTALISVPTQIELSSEKVPIPRVLFCYSPTISPQQHGHPDPSAEGIPGHRDPGHAEGFQELWSHLWSVLHGAGGRRLHSLRLRSGWYSFSHHPPFVFIVLISMHRFPEDNAFSNKYPPVKS